MGSFRHRRNRANPAFSAFFAWKRGFSPASIGFDWVRFVATSRAARHLFGFQRAT
jgi:hypothetical protein